MGSKMRRLLLAPLLLVSACFVVPSPGSTGQALAFSSSTRTTIKTGFRLHATKTVVFDGPEWSSIQQAVVTPDSSTTNTQNSEGGVMTVAVGTRNGERTVGVVAAAEGSSSSSTVVLDDTSIHVYEHAMAPLPANIPEQDALNTVVAALVGIQCTAPRVEGVGGASSDFLVNAAKVVVLGGSDYAAFCADGLAACGCGVSLVTTNSNNVKVKDPNGMLCICIYIYIYLLLFGWMHDTTFCSCSFLVHFKSYGKI